LWDKWRGGVGCLEKGEEVGDRRGEAVEVGLCKGVEDELCFSDGLQSVGFAEFRKDHCGAPF
jgi:hypothetical protein